MTTVDPLTVVALVAVVSLAAVVNGATGFGFALLAVNALALVLDAKNGVIVMSTITPIVSGYQAWHHRRRTSAARRLGSLIVGALVGSIIGTQLLVVLPSPAISFALGAFTIWFAISSLRAERPALTGATQRWLGPIAGLVGGISNSALGASGPVLGTYLTAIGLRGADFAFAISIAFFVMGLLRVGLLALFEQYTVALVAVGLALAVPATIGQWVGLWFQGRLPAATVYRGVLVVLLLAGTNLVVRAALAALGPPSA